MALVTEESPPSSRSTENSPEASNNAARDEAPATSTASEARSYRPPAQIVDHSAERNDDPATGGTAPDPAAQDVQSQLLQKILGTLEESNKTLKESTQTLKASTIAQETGTDTRSRFWATYKRQAEDYDSEFLEKYKDDMDIVLIFSGLFSAVSTTFITALQSSLSPDPTDTTNALLRQLIQATNSSAFAGQSLDPPTWNGPGTTVIWTQSFLYASLCASLLAALGAVLGKQWLGHYRRRGSGTIEDRGKLRQKKLNALEAWHFHAVLEVLPVLLQISLLLFGVSLSAYVWTEQSVIGGVVIGTTAFGILFYISITLASLISPNCPFRTPVSSILPVLLQLVPHSFKDHVVVSFDDLNKMEMVALIAKKMILSPVTLILNAFFFFIGQVQDEIVPRAGRLWQMLVHRSRTTPDSPGGSESSLALRLFPPPDPLKSHIVIVIASVMLFPLTLILLASVSFVNWAEVKVAPRARHLWQMVLRRPQATSDSPGDPESSSTSSSPPPPDPLGLDIPSLPIDSQGALSIKWLLETSTDPDVIATAAGMVPEVEWPVELDVSDLFGQLRDTFKGCFVPLQNTSNQWKIVPFGQERALVFGKAIVHLYCNRFYPSSSGPDFCYTTMSDEAGNRELPALFASLEHCDTKNATSTFVCAIARLSLSVGEMKYSFDPQPWHEELPPVPESCRTWVPGLFPHLLAHPLCPLTLKLTAMAEITRWITSPPLPQHILSDCILSAAILIGVRIDRKELVKVDKSSAIELLLERLRTHLPTLSDMRDARHVGVPALYAGPLLQMLSCLVEAEMLSRFDTCESKSCGCKVAEWGLRAWHSWMGEIGGVTTPKEDPIRVAMSGCAQAALRIGAVASYAHGPVSWGSLRPSCGSPLGWEISDQFHWVLAFLNHHHGTQDRIAIAGMVVVLSQSRQISLWAHEPAFIAAIIVAMGSDNPTRVRHIALRIAWEIRGALKSPNNAILPMLPAFSAALRSAVLTNISSVEDTTTPDSPNRYFYEERDLHYVQIIYALVRSSDNIWYRHLHDDQHFDRCVSITKYPGFVFTTTPMAVYLAAIVENLEAHGTDHSLTNDDVKLLNRRAWCMMYAVTRDREELLVALIASTQRHRDASTRLAQYIRDDILITLERLQREQPRSPVIDSLNELLVWPRAG